MKLKNRCIRLLLTAMSALTSGSIVAQGNLLISPRRVVLDANNRVEEINLANTGKDTFRYLISLVEMEMNENGSIAMYEGSDSGKKWSSPYLRYYPHEVVLAPNEAQIVRIQYAKSAALNPGEYRSHLYFRAKFTEVPLGDTAPKASKTLSVSLAPTFGLCIPVIIKVGENHTTLTLSNLFFSRKEEKPKLSMTLEREGNMSVYGDVIVDYVAPEGKITRVGAAKGIAVYTSVGKRQFSLSLSDSEGIDYSKGKLQIAFTENNAEQSKIAEASFSIN